MNTKTTLDQLRRRAYLAYHRDGIIDILIGATIIGWSLWLLLDNIVFNSISWMSFILYVGLKNAITIPRFGFVQFDESNKRKASMVGLGVGLLLFVAIVGVLFFVGPDFLPSSLTNLMRKYDLLVLGAFGGLAMVVAGFWSGIQRLVVYAAILVGLVWLFIELDLSGLYALLISGSLIVTIGLVLMVKFILRYPLHPAEDEDVS